MVERTDRQRMTPIPEPVARVADLMSTFRPRWFLCGGWAVDAWLGRQTRDHGDIDIAVFQDDLRALFEHLAGWQLIAHDPTVAGNSSELWDGRPLVLPAHIHARSPEVRDRLPDRLPDRLDTPAQAGFGLEIQINGRSGNDWILSREPHVTLPLRRCVEESAWGLPTAVPEVLLFYKATAYLGVPKLEYRTQDRIDFLALVPHLTKKRRDWLWEAMSLVQPDHPWLPQLSL